MTEIEMKLKEIDEATEIQRKMMVIDLLQQYKTLRELEAIGQMLVGRLGSMNLEDRRQLNLLRDKIKNVQSQLNALDRSSREMAEAA